MLLCLLPAKALQAILTTTKTWIMKMSQRKTSAVATLAASATAVIAVDVAVLATDAATAVAAEMPALAAVPTATSKAEAAEVPAVAAAMTGVIAASIAVKRVAAETAAADAKPMAAKAPNIVEIATSAVALSCLWGVFEGCGGVMFKLHLSLPNPNSTVQSIGLLDAKTGA